MNDDELATLQTALVDALERAASPPEAFSLLARASLSEAAREWIARSDARSMEIAIALVRRWTKRHDERP